MCYRTHSGNRKGVLNMDKLIPFLLTVAAEVVGYYICKWLDGYFKSDN